MELIDGEKLGSVVKKRIKNSKCPLMNMSDFDR